jgi:UDP-N-acetylmuramate dehydrogenase
VFCFLNKINAKNFFLNSFDEENIFFDELMSKHTSFKIGGPCDVLFLPKNIFELIKAIEFCKKNFINYFIVGNGTNLLVSDNGFHGVIIKINKNMSAINLNNLSQQEISVESGFMLAKLSRVALENNLSGLEFACGIPGTIGGAVCMNAGAYDSEIKNILVSAKILCDNKIKIFSNRELKFTYRESIIKKNMIVLSIKIKLKNSCYKEISQRMKDFTSKRINTQPINFPSAGSIFKKIKNQSAGKLIMNAGLAGFKIGGAQISQKHCGFIINTNNATAQNVIDLITYITNKIKKTTNIKLEPEIKFLN